LTIGLLALTALPAHAEIYKCADRDGHVTYSNVAAKGCAKLNLDPISTVPSAAKPATRTPTPSTFPRVEDSTQKARDTDRRKILEQEQAAEQKSLEEARKKLAEGEAALPQERMQGGGINQAKVQERTQPLKDQVQLHERNLEAIRKELQNLR
jgi:multidrug resistance efflux pump